MGLDPALAAATVAGMDHLAAVIARADVAGSWAAPSALVGYSVGGLAGHAVFALRRLEEMHARALDPEVAAKIDRTQPPLSFVDWFSLVRVTDPDDLDDGRHPVLRQSGEDVGADGPEAVALEAARVAGALRDLLPAIDDDLAMPIAGSDVAWATVETYVRSRCLEAVVHADDLLWSLPDPAAALAEHPAPPGATDVALACMLELARHHHGDLALLRAFARTERAPTSLSSL